MFRRLLLPLFLALLSLPALAATPVTVSGTNQSVGTAGLQGNSFVRFRLRNFAGFVPRVVGTGIIVQAQLDVQPANDGTFSTPIWANDDITPNTCGVTHNLACTWYTVEFWSSGKITASGSYCIPNTSPTYDLNSATPCQTPPLPAGPIQITTVNGGQINGTLNHVLKFTGPQTAGDSEGVATGVAAAYWPLGANIANAGVQIQKQNSSSPGTTQYLLAAKDPVTGLARNAQSADANALIGITVAGAGTTGSASIVVLGNSLCTFDNQTAIGDWAVLGATSQCHDAGVTQPVGVSSIIKITSVNTGPGTTATVDVGLPDVSSNSANTATGGNGTVNACATNGAIGLYILVGNTLDCDSHFLDDGAGNLTANSFTLNGSGGGFQFFGQGAAPTLAQANAVYFYAPASVATSFGTAWPSAPGTVGQVPTITSVPDATHIVQGYSTPVGNAFFAVTGPATSVKTFTFPNANATVLTTNALVTVAQGGTGLASGTSGGILGFTASGTMASSAALTLNGVLIGGGAGATPTSIATDATTTHALFATAGAPAFRAFAASDIPAALSSTTSVNGTTIPASSTLAKTIASGTSALGTGAIASGTCATVVTTSATGTLTTDVIAWIFNADPTGVVGYQPSASGMLTIIPYPTVNNANFKVCNNTAGSITPGAITLNWHVIR